MKPRSLTKTERPSSAWSGTKGETVIVRRNAIAVLIGIELMLNAANLNLVAFDRFGPAVIEGQVFALFVLVIAAAEAAVALAIILNVFDTHDRVDVDRVDRLKG